MSINKADYNNNYKKHFQSKNCSQVKQRRLSSRLLQWVREAQLNVSSTEFQFSSVQFSSVTQLCPTLCDPMDCSTPGLSDHHQLPEFTQTHIKLILSHWGHLTISSSVNPFSFHLQSFLASESFPMSQLFA